MIIVFGILFLGIKPQTIFEYLKSFTEQKKNSEETVKKQKKEKLVSDNKPEPYLQEGDYTDYICEDEDPDSTPAVDPEIFERIKNEINAGGVEIPDNLENIKPAETEQTFIDLNDVFNDVIPITEEEIENALELERTPITEEVKEEKKPPVKKPYVFPPLSLLKLDKKPNNEDVTDELRSNATKLVDTLASFKVRTKIIDISRGPTITRYELAPEEGVRVRQIANLVDDISLSLASSGIRIEAPIPGKAAVGIEVPNKVVATVFLRELLENPTFKNSKSNVTVSLGMDVAGSPIFVDIAKMPHLLIAGATGMGKSVCINSMIVSLLYKSNPDEVKLILIDPKKVEFNIYNGLPQLLIPVVSDPKKAAGALHWAVAEMERRFALIENVGVRDIYNFNMTTKDDPTYEYMPHVVIVIDELADLMMTAPDEVEDSICRLAQKARAAGMHLIIGTQRPSVDVITGLIKANIPSRIACTVASQVDSRTILDTAGAEKLIGRGDMLYAPVGAAKPIRVQGAFVSEQEVEAVTEFIRSKSGESEYDNEVIEKIEKEAAKCGIKKGASVLSSDDEDDEDADPMLKSAIELAIESGKISTSLIQRKLSLGYGRAAKLIDRMEKMGIVGAPEGNKPREVLMSRAEYLEKIMNSDVEE
ncbi:MAG: DNA translocase FtsK [Clostridia bacterium]|nr:DNA translocase FtsK [Clostridia bacterium]